MNAPPDAHWDAMVRLTLFTAGFLLLAYADASAAWTLFYFRISEGTLSTCLAVCAVVAVGVMAYNIHRGLKIE